MTSTRNEKPDIVVRFAPSPNGLLHLGHGFAAITAYDYARKRDGRLLLRIEDIDTDRSRPEFVEAILADLKWLGMDWDGNVIFQSRRFDSYNAAVELLKAKELLYPCFCTRTSMRQAQDKEGATAGPDGPIYPGTCHDLDAVDVAARIKSEAHSWRLDVEKASALAGPLTWYDEFAGTLRADPAALGDVVIVPKTTPIAYHLAVTVDDARDCMTHVVRGQDLFASTHIHRLLQALLDLPTPTYVHHQILLDESGQKLSKSRHSDSLQVLRESGADGRKLADDLRNSKFPVGITRSKA